VTSDNREISDVLIIGGGVIGMSLARELKKRGAGKVLLLERGTVGQEASFAAAGMLSPQSEAESRSDFFDFCYESRGLYENFAAELKEESGIDVKLETSGTLFVSFNEEDSKKLDKIYAWQKAAGLEIGKLTREEILQLEPNLSREVLEGVIFPRDAQVDNRLLVRALESSIKHLGVDIRENTAVEKLLAENGRITGAAAGNNIFPADKVVLATGAWSSHIKLGIKSGVKPGIKHGGEYCDNEKPPVSVVPVRGQMISFSPVEKLFTRVIYTSDGYMVPRTDNKILIGATVEDAGFTKEVTKDGVEYLLKRAEKIAPLLSTLEISEKWAGLRPRCEDDHPVLGACKGISGLYVATGHYRNGILLAPLTAGIMADNMITGNNSIYLDVFGPNRFLNALAA
jgi:glycine oxidase